MKNNLDKNINLIAIKYYINPSDERIWIYKENRSKSGIYCWYNKITKKVYVGSSISLNKRLSRYLSEKYLKGELLRYNSHIYKSMLKHGYTNFNFCILKYCDRSELIKWEQYYIDILKPEYNTMVIAASNLGFTHSEKTKEILRLASTGRLFSQETKNKLYANSQSFPVKVTNIDTGETKELPSIGRAAVYIGIWKGYLSKCIIKKGFYKGRGFLVIKI